MHGLGLGHGAELQRGLAKAGRLWRGWFAAAGCPAPSGGKAGRCARGLGGAGVGDEVQGGAGVTYRAADRIGVRA